MISQSTSTTEFCVTQNEYILQQTTSTIWGGANFNVMQINVINSYALNTSTVSCYKPNDIYNGYIINLLFVLAGILSVLAFIKLFARR